MREHNLTGRALELWQELQQEVAPDDAGRRLGTVELSERAKRIRDELRSLGFDVTETR